MIVRSILLENSEHVEAKRLQQDIEKEITKPATSDRITKSLQKTLSIDFKDALLKQVFEVFSRTTSVNFVFDKDVRTDQRVTVFLKGTTVKEALEVVLFTNQLEQRALDTNTILIYPNTPIKAKDYQSLTVRGFFLSYAEPEPVANILKSLLKMRDVVIDKRQNLITVRDTPETVRLAEKLIALHDLPEPEVMLDVEILEVNRTRLTELGIKYPDQLTLTPLPKTSGGSVTLDDLKNLGSSGIGASISPVTVNFKRQTGDVNLLANPRIRARNRDTAKILIGDKVPNITTTSTSTGFVSSNVQYLDVGLKLEVVPTITPDNEIAIKIALEVSNIASQVKTSDGTVAFQIGTRNASTVLRLKDGENQILAGLINDDDRRSASKIPLLGDLPVLGRLFGSYTDDGRKSEIVLSITPRLVRSNSRPNSNIIEFDSGTESGSRGASSNFAGRIDSNIPTGTPPGGLRPPIPTAQLIPPQNNTNPPTLNNPNTTNNNANAASNTPTALAWVGPSQLKSGSTTVVSLRVNATQNITGIPLAISYPSDKFEIQAVQEGDFLARAGSTAFSQRVDAASGQIFITNTLNNSGAASQGASGAGNILTLTFKAIGSAGNTGDVRLITAAPIGLNGASISLVPPPPFTLTIIP